MQKNALDPLAIGLLMVFCTIWGLQQVAIKLASTGISPVWQAGLRSIGARVIVFVWARIRSVPLFERDETLLPGLFAGLLFASEFALIFLGLEYTTAAREHCPPLPPRLSTFFVDKIIYFHAHPLPARPFRAALQDWAVGTKRRAA